MKEVIFLSNTLPDVHGGGELVPRGEVRDIMINAQISFSLPGGGVWKTVVENSLGQGHKSY